MERALKFIGRFALWRLDFAILSTCFAVFTGRLTLWRTAFASAPVGKAARTVHRKRDEGSPPQHEGATPSIAGRPASGMTTVVYDDKNERRMWAEEKVGRKLGVIPSVRSSVRELRRTKHGGCVECGRIPAGGWQACAHARQRRALMPSVDRQPCTGPAFYLSTCYRALGHPISSKSAAGTRGAAVGHSADAIRLWRCRDCSGEHRM
jgi:hypothetical protein